MKTLFATRSTSFLSGVHPACSANSCTPDNLIQVVDIVDRLESQLNTNAVPKLKPSVDQKGG